MNQPLYGPQRRPDRDMQQLAFAQALMKDAANTAPASTGVEALARALTGGVGGFFANQANQRMDEKERGTQETYAQALRAGTGYRNPDKPDQVMIPGSMEQMAAVLAGNPNTAEAGMNMQINSLTAQQKAALDAAAKQREYELKLKYDPQIAGATEAAKNPALLDRKRGEFDLDFAYKPKIEAAVEGAKNPALIERAGGEANARLPAQQALAATNADLDVQKAGPIATAQEQAKLPGQSGTRENTLRDEYNNLTKDFRVVQDSYSKIKGAANTGAGDMSMLYSYVKLLDPSSVVRESEFATAAASGSLGERIQGLAQRIISGQRLPDSLRADFMREADNIYKAQQAGAERVKTIYTDMAKRGNLDPRNVIVDYAAPPVAAQPPAALPPPGQTPNGGWSIRPVD